MISFPSISKWYQANHGAKDGIMVHSDWYHASKGEQLLPLGFIKLVHILLHMVNMLGQATWIQLNLNSYLCERVVINYQKGGG